MWIACWSFFYKFLIINKQIINVIVLQLENTYPHNSVVDNALIPLLVWDTAITEKVNIT
jgi:hypothetical protein